MTAQQREDAIAEQRDAALCRQALRRPELHALRTRVEEDAGMRSDLFGRPRNAELLERRRPAHRRIERADDVEVHRDFRPLEQSVRIFPMIRIKCNADACLDSDRNILDNEGRFQGFEDFLYNDIDMLSSRQLRQQNGKFISTQACDEIGLP